MRPRPHEFIAIGVIAGSMLMHEILLTRICALRLQFHFAYLIISNCLLGLGAGGSVLAYNQERWRPDARRQLGRFSLAYAIALVFTYLTLRLWSFPRELELSNPLHLLSLTVYNLVGAMPFFFGGIVVGMLLTFRAEHANRLYAVDLLGAGAGCLLCPLLLPWVGAGGVFVLTVMLAASASIAIDWDRLGKARIPVVLATLIVGLCLLPRLDALLPLPSKGSEFFWLPAQQQPRVEYSAWTSNSRIDYVLAPAGMPAVIFMRGRAHRELVAPREWAYISQDATAGTALINFTGEPAGLEVLRRSMYSTAFRLRPGGEALVIGLGGGNDVWSARANGVAHVKAIELNAPIVGLHEHQLRSFSRALVEDPAVELMVGEGRSALMRDPHHYDVVQMSGIDTWTALASGAYVLAENYLYTREAIVSMYEHLKPGGVLQIARFADTMETLRLLSNLHAALDVLGVAGLEHSVMVLKTGDRMLAVQLKNGAFTDAEQNSTLAFCADNGIDLVYAPMLPQDTLVDRFVRSPDKQRIIADFSQNIGPTVDDLPYFFNFTRWDHPLEALKRVHEVPAVSQGNPFFIFAQLALSLVLSGLLILWPLTRQRRTHPPEAKGILLYFSALGAGFILIEIAVIQKLTLFLGHPMYSLTVTLFALLVFTGLGSLLLAPRFSTRGPALWLIPLAIAICVTLFNLAGPKLFAAWIGSPVPLRMSIAALSLAPLGLVLGIPFALGLRVAHERDPWLTAWAWGINGCLSVLGSIASVVLSMNFGFSVVMWIAVVIYGIGFAALHRVLAR
jgi:hypothetical protein